jgi:hypothetical protein
MIIPHKENHECKKVFMELERGFWVGVGANSKDSICSHTY